MIIAQYLGFVNTEGTKQVTANNNEYRYLVFSFRGKGQSATRVHGINGKTVPYITNDGDFTFSGRTILRSLNLLVLRGSDINTHMIGPCDFYGPLERPHLYDYTITIDNGFPRFFRTNKEDREEGVQLMDRSLSSDFTNCSIVIDAMWYPGNHSNIEEIKRTYTSKDQKATGESLFPTKTGILAIKQEMINLPTFDATQCDLSGFKARLVRNDVPFSIADQAVSRFDSFCPVSYMFEGQYSDQQVERGGGLFLETHDFCQTMTPLDEMASGIVILGRWLDDTKLELIGVKIPYGYTLIIEKGCIHGDTPLKGMYLMAMTSNHVTMQTTDVVFLKNRENGMNFLVNYDEGERASDNSYRCENTPAPIVHFGRNKEEIDQFTLRVNNGWSIYNPISRMFNPFY